MAWTIPWNLIALEVSGDVGDNTIYTNRFGKKVVFPKAPPDKPPTFNQMIQRARFKNAQASWSSLSNEEKDALELSTKTVSAPLTGQNLWISCNTRNDYADLQTFERQSGVQLPAPVEREPVSICSLKPGTLQLRNIQTGMIQGIALTDTMRCGSPISFAIQGVPLAFLAGECKNGRGPGRPAKFTWLGGLELLLFPVFFSFVHPQGCTSNLLVNRFEN